MNSLWLVSGSPTCFLVPDQEIIINKQGDWLASAAAYRHASDSPEALGTLLEQIETVILVADSGEFATETLAKIPPHIAKIGLLTDKSDVAARTQLDSIEIDGYASTAMQSQDIDTVVHKICESKKANNSLQDELKSFSNIAFTAMSSASEMGVVAVYAEKVQEAIDLQRLAQLAQGCARDLGLESIIQFAFDNEFTIFPKNTSASYKRLLQGSLDSSARIISHGRFLLFSFTHVQFVVTDAPHQDADRYGRLRDVLAHVVSITEARAKTLRVNELLKAQQDNTRMVMMLLEAASSDNRNAVKEIMNNLSLSLRSMALGLDLNMEQESALMGLSEQALNSLESLQEATSTVEEHFRSLLEQLNYVAHLLEVGPVTTGEPESESLDSKVSFF